MAKKQLAGITAGMIAMVVSSAALAGDATTVTVFKTPWCGCCKVWTDAVEAAGYKVVIEDMEDLSGIKKQAGVPDEMQACHTAVIDGERKYVLEGHVPLEAVDKLMNERPDIHGIAVPGMPQGSLGMGYDPGASYTVYALDGNKTGTPQPFLTTGQ
jgi:hypothetical protein